jgi:Ca2+-binding RTX toxin-like protein
VTDANEAPTDIALSAATVQENAAGAVIGDVTVTDPDAGDTHTLSVDDGRFEIVGGQLKLRAGQSLDFEAASSVVVNITATDAGGLSRVEAFTIAVTDVFETIFGTPGIDTLTGTANDDVIFGLASNDLIFGLGGNDYIDGGTGNDRMVGGDGNDTYIVDSTTDVIVENPGEGRDLVRSSVSYTLAGQVEDLVLTGAANIHGIGNTLANVITGNSGNNSLRGNGGNDVLNGGAGNDYLIAGGGDTVTLIGGSGNDIIDRGVVASGSTSAVAVIQAGTGDDQIYFGLGYRTVRVEGQTAPNHGSDSFVLQPGISIRDIYSAREGDDAVIGFTGTSDKLVLVGFYGPPSAPLAESSMGDMSSVRVKKSAVPDFGKIRFADGTSLNLALLGVVGTWGADLPRHYGGAGGDLMRGGLGGDLCIAANVESLVQAMALYTADAADGSVSGATHAQHNQTIAAAWQTIN